VTLHCISGGAKPPGWPTFLGLDRSGPWRTGSLLENLAFTESDVRVIMSIIRVLIEELLCKAVTGQILVLEFMLSGAH
jgi:hypothetical protein